MLICTLYSKWSIRKSLSFPFWMKWEVPVLCTIPNLLFLSVHRCVCSLDNLYQKVRGTTFNFQHHFLGSCPAEASDKKPIKMQKLLLILLLGSALGLATSVTDQEFQVKMFLSEDGKSKWSEELKTTEIWEELLNFCWHNQPFIWIRHERCRKKSLFFWFWPKKFATYFSLFLVLLVHEKGVLVLKKQRQTT